MGFKGKVYKNINTWGEEASTDVEAAVGGQDDLAKNINEGGYIKQQIFHVGKQSSVGRRCHQDNHN